MSAANPAFFKTPFRYMRWASIHKPAYFYSIMVGLAGPVMVVVAPPVRRYLGDGPRPKIPFTYPIPKGPRPRPEGYDDE
ncbi:hypothetical protein K504DRAFT_2681 [Pleomassaria siparia CBS 279.74]|uniref:NADH-ubiquinone oxidoreductase 9.5 kDa subunit n=1 Tax=Pleomassaria siparia CBS 279.74 TaxID=1314801 RepID=A0A6G1KQ00_9PLEO|nr:hypothetical protein K504DRAFT_2681 [Pleomassaria siparia CBS 279.74]